MVHGYIRRPSINYNAIPQELINLILLFSDNTTILFKLTKTAFEKVSKHPPSFHQFGEYQEFNYPPESSFSPIITSHNIELHALFYKIHDNCCCFSLYALSSSCPSNHYGQFAIHYELYCDGLDMAIKNTKSPLAINRHLYLKYIEIQVLITL